LQESLIAHGKTVFLRTHPSTDNFFGNMSKKYLLRKGRKAHVIAALFYLLDVIQSIILFLWRSFDFFIFVY
jgi:dTMP kinase